MVDQTITLIINLPLAELISFDHNIGTVPTGLVCLW